MMSFIKKIPTVHFQSIKKYALKHKIISTIIVVAVLVGGYGAYAKLTSTALDTRYVVGAVSKGTIVASVSASGQVSTSNQIDIKPKVSGQITWVGVKAGDTVYAGQGLLGIDSTDAKNSLINAKQSLAASKLQLQKDTATAPIDYQKQLDALASAKDDLTTEYNNAYNNLSNTYLDLPNVMAGMQNTLYGYDLSATGNQWNIDVIANMFSDSDDAEKMQLLAESAKTDYVAARAIYDPSLIAYKQSSRDSTPADIEALLTRSINTTTDVAKALQSELNLLGSAADLTQKYNRKLPTAVTTMQTNTRSYLSTVNSSLSTLLAEKKSLASARQLITTDEQNITLLQVGNPTGANPISLQISQNNITSQEQNIAQLEQALADHTVVAPFSGVLASVSAKVGDTTSGAIATIITTQKVAVISLNEVDAAKVKLGDKATLTFDAIDTLTLTGKVSEMDSVGTVSQGVVSYNLKITFDTQDERVKPGMTVNATIQSATKQDVLMVPSSAVKTQNGISYVQIFTPPLTDTGTTGGVISKTPPQLVEVVTGLSDDTDVEIVSGLSEGEQIVTRTIAPGTTATTQTARAGGATGTTQRGFGATGATQIRL